MFGYVKPNISELKVREYELYKASYCGLCRTMGKTTGCLSKLTLSYDFAFLSLMRMVLENVKGEIKMRRCPAHILKKRPMIEPNPSLKYAAQTSAVLTKLKLKDNIKDSRGMSKLKAKLVGIIRIFFKKTDKSIAPLEEKIISLMDKISALENEKCDSVDEIASVFGEILAWVNSFGIEGEIKDIAYNIGFHLGKWIYVIDACDDFSDDIKTGSYNPIVISFGNHLTESIKDMLRCALTLELSKLSENLEKLDFSEYRDVEAVIKNVIYDGMRRETEKILKI